jgi:hypothetical protein
MATKLLRTSEMRKLQRQSERNQSPPMRSAYPAIGQLRIDLKFMDRPPRAPSTQSHTLYPSANAYFRFACPCADCDGEYDLTSAVRTLAAAGAQQTSTGSHLKCEGVRLRDRAASATCVSELDYQLAISPAPALV